MPSPTLTPSNFDTLSNTQAGPVLRIDGSRRRVIDKSALTTLPTTSSHSHPRESSPQLDAYLHHFHLQSPQRCDSKPLFNNHHHSAYIDPLECANLQDITARKALNALQPISRLNPDVLEYLFLIGASLVTSCSASNFPTAPSPPSLAGTILAYAQITSTLRQVALSSARLWCMLVDFEHCSEQWLEELLRRSKNVELELLFQWSKAHSSFHGAHISAKNEVNPHDRRDSWSYDIRNTPNNARLQQQELDLTKNLRLKRMLRPDVLNRARSVGVAIPAPHFSDTLLVQLAGYDGGHSLRRLDRLEGLRIVRSRPRTGAIEIESEVEHSEYVPLAVLAAAPRLGDLAIAESCLPFHELLPYIESPSAYIHSTAWPADIHSSLSIQLRALQTLRNLRALHIVDLPLSLAPTAREWLVYLGTMPSLQELVLEGAILGQVDLGPRAMDRSRTRVRGAMERDEDDDVNQGEDVAIGMVSFENLPRLRMLTLDAALEDVGIMVSHLPLPFGSPSMTSSASQVRHEIYQNGKEEVNKSRPYKWTLLCAEAHAGQSEGLDRVLGAFSRATESDSTLLTPLIDGQRLENGENSRKEPSLSLSATEKDIHVHLRSQPTTSFEAPFSIYADFHVGGGLGTNVTATESNMRNPSACLIPLVFDTLGKAVLPQIKGLKLDIPHLIGDVAFKNALSRGSKIVALSLGDMAAKSVLKILQQGTARQGSISSYSSSSDEDSSLSQSKTNILPSLASLSLSDEIAGGPAWIPLVRCIKARRAAAVPIKNVCFVPEQKLVRQSIRRVDKDDLICSDRLRELQRLGVVVAVKEIGPGDIC